MIEREKLITTQFDSNMGKQDPGLRSELKINPEAEPRGWGGLWRKDRAGAISASVIVLKEGETKGVPFQLLKPITFTNELYKSLT